MSQNHTKGKLNDRELVGVVLKNLLYGRITYLHSGKGQEMAPTMGANDNTLLVRKLPVVDTRYVSLSVNPTYINLDLAKWCSFHLVNG